MKKTVAALMAVIMALILFPATVFAEETDGRNLWVVQGLVTYGQTEARSMLDLINQFRTNQQEEKAGYWNEDNSEIIYLDGLGTLQYDYQLEREAMCRAAELSIEFSHTCPNGEACWAAAPHSSGENIACGYTNAADVFRAWREDAENYEGQGHRRNMLDGEFTSVGVGHAVVGGVHYWVQEFGMGTYNSNPTDAIDTTTIVTLEVDLNRHPEIANGPALPGGEQQVPEEPAEPSEPEKSAVPEAHKPEKTEEPAEFAELEEAGTCEESAKDGESTPDVASKPAESSDVRVDTQGNVSLAASPKEEYGVSVLGDDLKKADRFMKKNDRAKKAVLRVGEAEITLDRLAMTALAEQVEAGNSIFFSVKEVEVKESGMNQAQQEAVLACTVDKLLAVEMKEILPDGTARPIMHLEKGNVSISLKYDLPQSDREEILRVEEDGRLTERKSDYNAAEKQLSWRIDGTGYYLLKNRNVELHTDLPWKLIATVICLLVVVTIITIAGWRAMRRKGKRDASHR